MTLMKTFPAPRCVLAMIGFSDSNISIILQLASCSPPALPLGPNWAAFICNPSCRLSLIKPLLSDSEVLPRNAVLPLPAAASRAAILEQCAALRCPASELSRIFGISPRMDRSKAVMRSSPPAGLYPPDQRPIAVPFQQIMEVTQPSIASLTISPTPGCKRQTR